MKLIDADKLKEKLLKIQAGIVNEKVARGNTKSDVWKLAYLLILDEYIRMLDDMPSETQHCDCNHDCDAIYEVYARGYSKGSDDILNDCNFLYTALRRAYLKGREDAINEYHLLKDYYNNNCDTLDKIQKEQNMKLNTTREEMWDKVIQNLKTLDAGLIVTMAEKLRTDVINGTIKQEDKSSMWSLVDDLGYYSIKGQTIKYLPEYQELTTLMEKVF